MVLATIGQQFQRWFGAFATFLKPAFTALARGGGLLLITAARDAVAAVAADPSLVDDKQKREAAFQAIAVALERQGIQVLAYAINLAIEAAVAELKHE